MKSRIVSSLYLIAIILASVLVFESCQKEESLSPRKDLAGAQEFDININPNDTLGGIGGGIGGGGGTGGGGISEYFNAIVDGTGASFDLYTYSSAGGSVIFAGTNSSNLHQISFSAAGAIASGQSYELNGFPYSASYRGSSTNLMISERGTLYIDTIASNYIRGTFFFDGINQNDPTDSVLVRSGTFQFEF